MDCGVYGFVKEKIHEPQADSAKGGGFCEGRGLYEVLWNDVFHTLQRYPPACSSDSLGAGVALGYQCLK